VQPGVNSTQEPNPRGMEKKYPTAQLSIRCWARGNRRVQQKPSSISFQIPEGLKVNSNTQEPNPGGIEKKYRMVTLKIYRTPEKLCENFSYVNHSTQLITQTTTCSYE